MKKAGMLILGAAALALTVAGVAYASGYSTAEVTAPQRAVANDFIPGSLTLNNWTYSGGNIKTENGGSNVGYVTNGCKADLDFHCNETGVYDLAWKWSYAKTGNVAIVISDIATGAEEINQNWAIADGQQTVSLEGLITEGDKHISLTFTGGDGFLGNYEIPTFTKVADTWEDQTVPAGWDVIPGSLDIRNWTYEGGLRLENNGDNVGYAKNGGKATHKFYCTEAGVYQLNINFYWFQNPGDFNITITDQATGNKEISQAYHFEGKHEAKIPLEGFLTEGKKDIEFLLTSASSGYLVNWKTPDMVKIADGLARITEVKAEGNGIEAGAQEGFDMAFNIAEGYEGSDVTFNIAYEGATLAVSAGDVAVTDLGNGRYSIPVPAPNAETVVTATLTPAEGNFASQTEYKVRFYRIGGVVLTGLDIDGFTLDAEKIATLNTDAALTVGDYVFTAIPVVKATFIDGTTATATPSLSGTKAVYSFKGTSGDKSKDFSVTVEGIHLFNRAESDLDTKIVYDGTFKQEDGSWSNGLFTINPCGDGWGGKQFKLKGNSVITLTTPVDMKIKQLVLAQLFDNYVPGRIKSITSEGADVWVPSASDFVNGGGNAYDLVVNVENHVAGTPFEIEIENGSQPVMWFEFVYEKVVPQEAPVLVSSAVTDLTGKNHAVVSFTFNREINNAEVEFNGVKVASNILGTTLRFPVWDLEYATAYTFTIPAGAVTDSYGIATDKPCSVSFTTGVKGEDIEAVAAENFIRVSTADELLAAVASLSTTNNRADSKRTVIFIHNGDYDLGVDLSANPQPCLPVNKVYNVSLIGESREGVLIHGTRDGISNPVLSTRYSSNIYMENFTVRNDLDFGKERVGVGVAHTGGNLDVMKNVTLQSQQDTQVTGDRGYYLNCTFHGTVDYVCGDGDHFYDRCTFIMEKESGVITAPSTSSSLRHGYVMMDCEIKGAGKYNLGRPWQNEPRNFWINTVMHTLPNDGGWGKMGNLVTHFYEYNSMDAAGNAVDLSKRTCPETSTNKYTPVLPEEYASYFNHRNVLGSADSWDATELTAECDAPVVAITDGNLKWNAVAGASGYIVYLDGQVLGYTTDTAYALETPAAKAASRAATSEYKVAAISPYGAVGHLSEAAKEEVTDGITEIAADSDTAVEYYNLQGVKVSSDAKGALIRVSVAKDGRRTATKVIR